MGLFQANLRNYFLNSQEDRQFYDFKIQCKDGVDVKCHKIVLVSQTKYFEGMFRQQPPETNCVSVDFHSDIVGACITYLYTGGITINGDNVQDILMAANYFLLNPVQDKCITYILDNMDLSDCVDILKFADSVGLTRPLVLNYFRLSNKKIHQILIDKPVVHCLSRH